MVFGGFSDMEFPGGGVFSVCSRLAEEPGLRHCFTTRLGGASGGCFSSMNLSFGRGDEDRAVFENYKRLTKAAGFSENGFAFTHQVHGTLVRRASASDLASPGPALSVPDCDAIFTSEPGVPLVGKTADCVPILLYCPRPRLCAFAHAGWRGTAANIVFETVKALAGAGADPADMIAAVGPSISPCCFLTHSDVTDALRALPQKATENAVVPCADGRFSVDLKRINASLLKLCGVKEIFVSTECTCCLDKKYFSHRRNGASRGSMATVIELV